MSSFQELKFCIHFCMHLYFAMYRSAQIEGKKIKDKDDLPCYAFLIRGSYEGVQ